MPKVTITRGDGKRIEISDLTFDQVKALVALNGDSAPSTGVPSRQTGVSLKPSDMQPDYDEFKAKLTPKAKQFIEILRRNPNGISADKLAEQLGFSTTTQIGGMAGGGLSKTASRLGVDLANVYRKEVRFDNGSRRVIYKPGKDIELLH